MRTAQGPLGELGVTASQEQSQTQPRSTLPCDPWNETGSITRPLTHRFAVARGVAAVNLEDKAILWVPSCGRDHITVWPPPVVLVDPVVQCDEHG